MKLICVCFTYNSEKKLKSYQDLHKKLVNLDYCHFICIDNVSQDNTREMIRSICGSDVYIVKNNGTQESPEVMKKVFNIIENRFSPEKSDLVWFLSTSEFYSDNLVNEIITNRINKSSEENRIIFFQRRSYTDGYDTGILLGKFGFFKSQQNHYVPRILPYEHCNHTYFKIHLTAGILSKLPSIKIKKYILKHQREEEEFPSKKDIDYAIEEAKQYKETSFIGFLIRLIKLILIYSVYKFTSYYERYSFEEKRANEKLFYTRIVYISSIYYFSNKLNQPK